MNFVSRLTLLFSLVARYNHSLKDFANNPAFCATKSKQNGSVFLCYEDITNRSSPTLITISYFCFIRSWVETLSIEATSPSFGMSGALTPEYMFAGSPCESTNSSVSGAVHCYDVSGKVHGIVTFSNYKNLSTIQHNTAGSAFRSFSLLHSRYACSWCSEFTKCLTSSFHFISTCFQLGSRQRQLEWCSIA